MKYSILNKFYLAMVVLVMLSACGHETKENDKQKVVVGIVPAYELAKAIAGDSLDVVCLLPRGGNPETYEPTMSQYIEVEQGAAFMYVNNMGFEAAIANRLKQNKPDMKLVDLSAGIELLHGTHGECSHHNHHGSCNKDNDIDPHVWSSAKNMRKIAKNILQAMVQIDADRIKYYEQNYKDIVASIDSIDAELTDLLASHKGEAFVVWHPSLGYFARDYDLEQISVGGQESKESSVNQLRERIENAKNKGARVMVVQQNYDDRQALVVNEQIGARMVEINPLSADWAGELKKVAYEIASERND